MKNFVYVVATIKPWNIRAYQEIIQYYPGEWHLLTDPALLTPSYVEDLKPKYIFFPHWNHLVPKAILNITNCVCFHATDLPYGRGGSPIQNLIESGVKETKISALKMDEKLDAGPIYLKKSLSLEGLAEEIFIRVSRLVAQMILEMITTDLEPIEQKGLVTTFKRRAPEQSKVLNNLATLTDLFDHIRMLDADGYPRAYIELDHFRYEISRPALRSGEILADVRITKIEDKNSA